MCLECVANYIIYLKSEVVYAKNNFEMNEALIEDIQLMMEEICRLEHFIVINA